MKWCTKGSNPQEAYVGRLTHRGDTATLRAPIADVTTGELDLVVVSKAGTSPGTGGVLYGTPDLFQRLYSRDYRVARNGPGRAKRPPAGGFLLSMAMPTLSAQAPPPLDLDELVAEGEELFFEETFNGNGRTCGTCHPAANNFTIDPPFIQTLPCQDALFVAEHAADRRACRAAPRQHRSLATLENPRLMREFGLILENNDGMHDLENNFNMRGVPHIFSQPLSLTPQTGSGGSATTPPNERTGWSGDGSPFGQVGNLTTTGSLRDFAVGAVIQHFPRTLRRQIGRDFRLPTPDELTAMEAFQRSVGHQEELNLATMVFRDGEVTAGRDVFNGAGQCATCHFNGGATAIFGTLGQNRNFDTNVEELLANNPDGTGEPRHPDGGSGTTRAISLRSGRKSSGSFGNATNSDLPSLARVRRYPSRFSQQHHAREHRDERDRPERQC